MLKEIIVLFGWEQGGGGAVCTVSDIYGMQNELLLGLSTLAFAYSPPAQTTILVAALHIPGEISNTPYYWGYGELFL